MIRSVSALMLSALLALGSQFAAADDYSDTINAFRNAGETSTFFENAYGYAVFPTIGKGGIGIGGAYGKGRVYVHGSHVGNTEMAQVTVSFQMGGQASSQMVFSEVERAPVPA